MYRSSWSWRRVILGLPETEQRRYVGQSNNVIWWDLLLILLYITLLDYSDVLLLHAHNQFRGNIWNAGVNTQAKTPNIEQKGTTDPYRCCVLWKKKPPPLHQHWGMAAKKVRKRSIDITSMLAIRQSVAAEKVAHCSRAPGFVYCSSLPCSSHHRY